MRSDLRDAVRAFAKTPALTSVIVVTLALGIGANTAIFTVVNAVLLRPLPYPAAERLLRVVGGSSYPDVRDWIEQTTSFAAIGGFRPQMFDYAGGPEPERLDGALVTGGLLRLLGARTLAGRVLDDADDRVGAAPAAVVSEPFWRTRLGADPAAIGRTIAFNGQAYTIVGVLEPGFTLPATKPDVLAAFQPSTPREAAARGAHTLRAVARLRDGASRGQAQDEMTALAVRLEQQYPETNRDVRFRLQPLADSLAATVRPALMLLAGTVAFVLLIACVNVANLLIARGAARREEFAIRAALGAGRARIVRQLLCESVLFAVAGGVLGLAAGQWITAAVVGLSPEGVPRMDEATLDLRVLGFTAAVAVTTGILFGLLPAWTGGAASLADASRGGARVTGAGGRARAVLVIAEIALSLVLVIGAGLLLRSFHALSQQPLGFDPSRLATANVTFNGVRYFDVARRTRIFEAFEDAVSAMPGVEAVALTTDLPIGGSPLYHNLAFEGRPMAAGTEPEVYYRGVNPSYFDALGIAVRRGRRFTRADRAGAPPVAIVNEAFVRQYFPAEEVLGRRIRWASGTGDWITIVGVAADVRGLALDRGEVPAVHVPYSQEQMAWRTWMDVAVRTTGDPAPLGAALRRELARIEPGVPLTRISTMDAVLRTSLADRRFNLYLLGGFAVLSLLLAAAGTYGVTAYTVAQRTRELGVRLALGARPHDLFRNVVGGAVGLAACGVAVGIAGALALSQVLASLPGHLFQVQPTDPATFAAASLMLIGTSAFAAYVPGRRAARVDPLVALRSE